MDSIYGNAIAILNRPRCKQGAILCKRGLLVIIIELRFNPGKVILRLRKKGYKRIQSNARANKRLKRIDQITGGHTNARHSATKSDKWLRNRALGQIPKMQPGAAATKFLNPNTHLKTLKLIEKRINTILRNGKPYPANVEIPKNLQPGKVIKIRREPMGYKTGRGYYSASGVPSGKNPGDPSGLLDKATGYFRFKGYDKNGNAMLEQITLFPDL
ncbi:MAG: hypothetical protein ACK4ND_03825 [Cytophagaceae bacterium]